MKQQRSSNQQGFTLIELIIVIVILGILAVTAAPRFLNLQSEARAGVLDGMRAAMQSASDLVHAKALVAGVQGDDNQTVIGENGATIQTDFGYAEHDWDTAWSEMLEANIALDPGGGDPCASEFCVDEDDNISAITGVPNIQDNTDALIIFPEGTSNPSDDSDACFAYYIYDDSGSSGRPSIGTITSGC